jgi:hypothetical protein
VVAPVGADASRTLRGAATHSYGPFVHVGGPIRTMRVAKRPASAAVPHDTESSDRMMPARRPRLKMLALRVPAEGAGSPDACFGISVYQASRST